MTEERAIHAGGCFWGVQDLMRRCAGVLSTRVGYTGGTNQFHDSMETRCARLFAPKRALPI